ncbi:MAG: glycosyltransferase family 2 protein [Ignavibacteriaceae bacterium]|nr:glycosyltransferase family 2 protein [Ignavibacteriaceae bacterium]
MITFGLENSNQVNSKTRTEFDIGYQKGKIVAGIVVLYNPSHSVIENINSYITQIERLYIVDNSDNPNKFLFEFINSNSKCDYIFNDGNLGVAAALNIGAKKAIESGYSYLLTMDQDSKALADLVENLFKIAQADKQIGIASPLHSNKFDTHIKSREPITEEMTVMTSGNLLSLNAYKQIGAFRDDFFIDYVDIEYCIRMNFNNFKVLSVNNIILEHDEGNLSRRKFLSKTFYPSNNVPSRLYYKTRNLFYLRNTYRKIYPQPLKTEYDAYLRNIVKVFLFEKQKLLKFRMILLGFWDYLRGKKGRKF